jgi:tetratricopeptide (TPR) repeat protein
MFSTACAAASWRYGEAHSWAASLRQWLENPPAPENAGAFAYNLGNTLADQGNWDEAHDAYASTLASDPTYGERPYFWAESAAANFETGNFEEASRCYEKALQLKDSPSYRWRLADALFNAAKFAQARGQLQIALPMVADFDRSYVELLLIVCDELHDVWGLEMQAITNIEEADQDILQRSESEMDEKEIIAYLRPLMNKNAIDGCFNFNAGVFASSMGHYSIAAYRFLICALRQRGDAEAWTNSISCAFNAGNTDLVLLSAKTAHFFLGEEFLPWALGMMPDSAQIPEQISDSWRALITDLTESFERDRTSRETAPVLRIHTPGSTREFKLT